MRLSIIGFGLLGSSLARAARRADPATQIQCVDRAGSVCDVARDLGLADAADHALSAIWPDADIVVMAAPVRAIIAMTPDVIDAAPRLAALTDLGSVKAPILGAAEAARPDYRRFTPAHPLAGDHLAGPEHGRATMFDGRRVILTPNAEVDPDAAARIRALFESVGARVSVMEAAEHDRAMGYVSHMPHLIAFAAMLGAAQLSDIMGEDALAYAAGGYRDFSRIAGSDPTMWADIFATNAAATREATALLRAELGALEAALDDPAALMALLGRASELRRALDAQQEPGWRATDDDADDGAGQTTDD